MRPSRRTMGSGESGRVINLPSATSSRQLEPAMKVSPRPASTNFFIISVESRSIETWMLSCTVSSQVFSRANHSYLIPVYIDNLHSFLADGELGQPEVRDILHHRLNHAGTIRTIYLQ